MASVESERSEDLKGEELGNNLAPHERRRNAKQWFVTIWCKNLANGIGIEGLHKLLSELSGITRYIIQKERCPSSGQEHYQGLIIFDKQKRAVPDLEKKFGLGWYRPAKHLKQAVKYCSKKESRVEGPWSWSENEDDKEWNSLCMTDGEFESTQVTKKWEPTDGGSFNMDEMARAAFSSKLELNDNCKAFFRWCCANEEAMIHGRRFVYRSSTDWSKEPLLETRAKALDEVRHLTLSDEFYSANYVPKLKERLPKPDDD